MFKEVDRFESIMPPNSAKKRHLDHILFYAINYWECSERLSSTDSLDITTKNRSLC